MRKLIILILAVILLIGLSGCSVLLMQGISAEADKAVKHADASNIASAYNDYRELYPDSPIGMEKSDFTNAETLHAIIGDDFWPRGLSTEAAEGAWPLVTITNGCADVAK